MDPYSQTVPATYKGRRPRSRRASVEIEPPIEEPASRRRVSNPIAALIGGALFAALTAIVLGNLPRAGAQGAAEPNTAVSVVVKTPTDWSVIGTSMAIIFVLTVFNAVFSMAETAITSVRRSRIEQLVEENRRGADAVKRLHDDPPRYIATVQAGITLLGFAASASAAIAIAPALQPFIALLGMSERIAYNVAVTVVVIVVAVITLVFGEIAPKAIAMQSADVWALRLAPFVNVCAVIFAPLNALALGLANIVVRPFGAKAQFETPMISREEFRAIIESGTEKGEFDREEQTIVENVIDFSETLVRSVMTPRIDMTAVPVAASLPETLQTVIASGHSRLPVFEKTSDTIVGIVHAKDLLPLFADGTSPQSFALRSVMRPPVFVPESRRVADLLAEMRRSKNQIAVVQDEYGGTAGIVSLEDLLEEIVGDIRDEYDIDEPEMKVLNAQESMIDGRMNIADVNDRLGSELSDEEYTTIGGLVFGLLGHEPTEGEHVQRDGITFVVDQMEKGRVKFVRAVRQERSGDAERSAEVVAAGGG
ncbi:MAG: HlyC/CorC family transporter [Akkermansiaceae bacterium]|nr:HlyC/CorC family transporter [Armatimonadota bacterium]